MNHREVEADADGRRTTSPAAELRGERVNATTLKLAAQNIDELRRQIERVVGKAPDLFRGAPLILDLAGAAELSLDRVVELTRELGFIPIGVRGLTGAALGRARELGLRDLPGRAREVTPAATPDEPAKAAPRARAKVIARPLRSGQQVFARDGDLVVFGSVSPGAEVLADGDIHVYGSLRGRALAGVSGDESAQIFCLGLEAELLSIAGNYRVLEDLDAKLRGQPTHVSLEDGKLVMRPIELPRGLPSP